MKSGTFSKIVVLFIIIVNIVFTIAVLWIFFHTGSEPQVLIGAWFAFSAGELWFLSGIKKQKIAQQESQGGFDQRQYK